MTKRDIQDELIRATSTIDAMILEPLDSLDAKLGGSLRKVNKSLKALMERMENEGIRGK